MKPKRYNLFLMLSIFALVATMTSCKEKNNEFPPHAWSEYTYANSEIAERVISIIYYENDHSIWLGAKAAEGLLHYDGYKWNIFDKNNTGIEFDSVTSIIRDGNDKLWVGWKNGLACYDGDKWQSIAQFNGLRVTGVAIEGIGIIRVAIKGATGGIVTQQNNEWQFETTTNSDIPSGNINSIVSDYNQVLWLASSDKGILRNKNEQWELMSNELPLLSQNFNSITKAPDGSIWAASTASQLVHFYNDTFTILNTGTSKEISSIVVNADGTSWFSTLGAGLLKFDGTVWTSQTMENSDMPSNDIVCLSLASPGYMFFSTQEGKLYLIKQ